MIDLKAIKARAENATAGPWYADICQFVDSDNDACGITVTPGETDPWKQAHIVADTNREECRHMLYRKDAIFIAHAREDIPALIARVEELEELVDRYRQTAQDNAFERDLND